MQSGAARSSPCLVCLPLPRRLQPVTRVRAPATGKLTCRRVAASERHTPKPCVATRFQAGRRINARGTSCRAKRVRCTLLVAWHRERGRSPVRVVEHRCQFASWNTPGTSVGSRCSSNSAFLLAVRWGARRRRSVLRREDSRHVGACTREGHKAGREVQTPPLCRLWVRPHQGAGVRTGLQKMCVHAPRRVLVVFSVRAAATANETMKARGL